MSITSRRRVLRGGLFGVACACVAPGFAYAYAESPTGKWRSAASNSVFCSCRAAS